MMMEDESCPSAKIKIFPKVQPLPAKFPAKLQLQLSSIFALEPIHFPKLRIYFADFPYPHSSIDQRLLTLET